MTKIMHPITPQLRKELTDSIQQSKQFKFKDSVNKITVSKDSKFRDLNYFAKLFKNAQIVAK